MRFALAVLALLSAAPLAAQRDSARVEIVVDSIAISEGPAIAVSNLLSNATTKDLLVNGAFPTGVRFRLELWRKGVFDDLAGRSEWNVAVWYEPTKQLFNVVRRQSEKLTEDFGGFKSLALAEAQFDRPFRVPLRPGASGRYYYTLTVEVQTLTETDLDAIQHWLRGTTSKGSSNPLSAIGRGIRMLLSRVLGGDKRRYVQASGVFVVP